MQNNEHVHTTVRHAAQELRGKVIAAAATPMTAQRRTDPEVTRAYFEALASGGAEGLAVAVHTGRGAALEVALRAELVRIARSVSPLVVTGVSADRTAGDALRWPRLARDAGASALLVVATPGQTLHATLARYDELWEATGLPLITFDLYTDPYPLETLRTLLGHPAVAAFKPARLHDAVACQDGIAAASALGRTVLSGEDRMLGPSLMWGASGALVGIAAASVGTTASLVTAHADGDASAFLRASAAVDALAAVTFRTPWDGYVQRMLWIAEDEGLIPAEYAIDPLRPGDLLETERDEVLAEARRLRHAPPHSSLP